jgi:hypothetical protein
MSVPTPDDAQGVRSAESGPSGAVLPALVNPTTGEVLSGAVEAASDEQLADFSYALHEHETKLKTIRADLDAELRRRLTERNRTLMAVGDYEVRIDGGNESVWDPDELETTLRRLIDDGKLAAREVTDVLHHETVVSRSHANRLLERLAGDAHDAVARCRSWRKKPGRIRVERSVALPDPAEHQRALEGARRDITN